MEQDLVQQIVKNPKEVCKVLKKSTTFNENVQEDLKRVEMALFGSVDIKAVKDQVKAIPVPMGVCGKIINNYDLLWFCDICGLTPNSGICQDCHTNSAHDGHKNFFRKGYIGVCDCGDPDAWKPSGFCSKHQGYDEKLISTDLFPPHVRVVAKPVVRFLAKVLNRAALDIFENRDTLSVNDKTIFEVMNFFDGLTTLSAIFAKLICESLNEYCFAELPLGHECHFRTYLTAEEEQQFPQRLEAKQNKRRTKQSDPALEVCKCKVLENLLKDIHFLSKDTVTIFSEFLVKLTKSPLLKDLLGYGLLANYSALVGEATYGRMHDEEALEKVSLQLFTIDELAHKFLQKEACRSAMVKVAQELATQGANLDNVGENDLFIRLFLLRRDFNYFVKPKTTRYILDNTDMLQSLLQATTALEFFPLYQPRATPIENDIEAGTKVQAFQDKFWHRILKSFLANVNYGDLGFCRKLGLYFRDLLLPQAERLRELRTESPGCSFFSTHIHRYFYNFFAMYIHTQLALAEVSGAKSWAETTPDMLRTEVRRLAKEVLTPNRTDDELDHFIEAVLAVSLTPLHLFVETRAHKWFLYGTYLDELSDVYYGKLKTIYFYPDFGLAQLLIGIYQGNPGRDAFELFLPPATKDAILGYFRTAEEPPTPADPAQQPKEIDGKQRALLEGLLHLLCCLCSNDTIGLMPFIRLSYNVVVDHPYNSKIAKVALLAKIAYLQRELVQFSMREANAKFPFSEFQDALPKKLRRCQEVEQVVKELCESTKDAKGQHIFSVKSDRLVLYDPFCYPALADISATLENVQQAFKRPNRSPDFDGILGSFGSFGTLNLRHLLVEKLRHSRLLPFVLEAVLCPEPLKATETIQLSALKLLSCFAAAPGDKTTLVAAIKANGSPLFAHLKKRATVDDISRHSCARFAHLMGSLNEELKCWTETSPSQDSTKSAKDLAKEKQAKAMAEIQKRQQKFLSDNPKLANELVSASSNEIPCAFCGEKLTETSGKERPFGKLAFVERSMVLLQAKKAAFPECQTSLTQEVHKTLDLPYTKKNGEGLSIVPCGHYIHIACWAQCQKKREIAALTLLMMTASLQDLQGQCPLCGCLSTLVVPAVVADSSSELKGTLAQTLSQELLSRLENKKELKELSGLQYHRRMLKVIQYNLQKTDIIGVQTALSQSDLLQWLVKHVNWYSQSQKFAEQAVEIITKLALPHDLSLHCDRSRALITNLYCHLLQKRSLELVPPAEIVELMHISYQLHVYALLLKLVLDRGTPPLTSITLESLLATLNTDRALVIRQSFKFVKKALCAYCVFCSVGPDVVNAIESAFALDDEAMQWARLNSGIIPFSFSKALEFEGQTTMGIDVAKRALEATLNLLKTVPNQPRELRLLAMPVGLKLYPLPTSYKELILNSYQKPCALCGGHIKEKGLCLYCGTVLCLSFTDRNEASQCQAFAEHVKVCLGVTGLTLKMNDGRLLAHYRELYHLMDSPYRDKFGSPVPVIGSQDDNYTLSVEELENSMKTLNSDKLPQLVYAKYCAQFKH